jgi:hypothetical protein
MPKQVLRVVKKTHSVQGLSVKTQQVPKPQTTSPKPKMGCKGVAGGERGAETER